MKNLKGLVNIDVFVDSSSNNALCSPISDNVVPPELTLSSYKNMFSKAGVNVGVASSMSSLVPNSDIRTMLQQDEETTVEILWCLHLVLNRTLQWSREERVELFPKMFPDSENL